MKKLRSFIALLLAVSQIALLAACSETPVTESESTPESDAVSGETEPVETEPVHKYINQLPEANFNNEDFNFFTMVPETLKDHFYAEDYTGEVVNDMVYQRNLEIEERYGVSFDFYEINWGGDEGLYELRNLYTSSDDTFELYTAPHNRMGSFMLQRYFYNINDIPEIDLSQPYYVSQANDALSIGDSTMLVFGDFCDSLINMSWIYLFNKKLVDVYNFGNLYDVVDEGKWTYDYFYSLIEDVREDLNGDGVYDGSDFYGYAGDLYCTVDSYARTFHMTAVAKDENNYPVLDFYSEDALKGYELIYKLCYGTNGAYMNNGAWGGVGGQFAPGNAIFANASMFQLYEDSLRDMEDHYGVLPYPKMYEADDYTAYLDGTFSSQMILYCTPEEKLEMCATIMNALNAYSKEYVIPAVYETTLKLKSSHDPDSPRMLDIALAGRRFSFDSMDEEEFYLAPIRVIRDNISKNVENLSSYYAKVEKLCTRRLDKLVALYEDAQ